MDIRIPIRMDAGCSNYEGIMRSLKQLELAIHFAQKSVKSAQDNGLKITGDSFICFEHNGLEQEIRDKYYDELQAPELRINLAEV